MVLLVVMSLTDSMEVISIPVHSIPVVEKNTAVRVPPPPSRPPGIETDPAASPFPLVRQSVRD